MNIAALDAMIREVAPIEGINSAGAIFFAEGATPAQKSAARAIMAENIGNLSRVVIPTITRRQFLIAAGMQGLITKAEALAASQDGTVPAAIAAVFEGLAPDEQFAAEVTWAAMTVIDRHDLLVGAVAASKGMTSAQVDAFFTSAGAL